MTEHITINNEDIIIKGIGKAFYQDGFPISMGIEIKQKQGYKISMLHIADELLKQGWKLKTVLSKLEEEKSLDINNVMDMTNVIEFVNASYEDQREMIYNYLFKDVTEAKKSLAKLITRL